MSFMSEEELIASYKIYTHVNESSIEKFKTIVDGILKLGGSSKTCDDLFEFTLDYSDWEACYDEYIAVLEDEDERNREYTCCIGNGCSYEDDYEDEDDEDWDDYGSLYSTWDELGDEEQEEFVKERLANPDETMYGQTRVKITVKKGEKISDELLKLLGDVINSSINTQDMRI